jgi:hypothetical protein
LKFKYEKFNGLFCNRTRLEDIFPANASISIGVRNSRHVRVIVYFKDTLAIGVMDCAFVDL